MTRIRTRPRRPRSRPGSIRSQEHGTCCRDAATFRRWAWLMHGRPDDLLEDAMIAANATVVKDVPPLAKYIPGKELGLNSYAIHKYDLPLGSDTLRGVSTEAFYLEMLHHWESSRDKRRPIYSLEASETSGNLVLVS